MAENSNIGWTHHTFNGWIGCTKISAACDNCYAEEWNKRYEGGANWGPKALRRKTSEAYWRAPIKWNKHAEKTGIRLRVFCSSLADVFDNQVPPEWRAELWELIKATPNLDWLLLTKRPQNIKKMLPEDWGPMGYPNVWLMATVENQPEAEKRIKWLLSVPAVVHGLSMEPLLGAVDLRPYLPNSLCDKFSLDQGRTISWVITGGESGSHYRFSDPDWFRSLRDQCQESGVAFFFKQWGGANQKIIKSLGRELDGKIWDQYPEVRKCLNGQY